MKYLFLLLILVLPGSCENYKIDSIDREDLFTLEIGPMEDQIALYELEGDLGIRRTGFTMRDGLFYIADGTSGKIVRYNSYGDLLFMIYNEETNPPPISLKVNIADDEQATLWAFTYPLREPGWITVDSRKHIFVEDRLPLQSYRMDIESEARLDGIILHFDQNGRFINYLGREGIGGSPFPRIIGLCSSIRDELAVICRIPGGWNVYWYNASGTLLYLVRINSSAIPSPPDWPQSLCAVDKITAAVDARKLYIKADYYLETYDQSTNTRTGTEAAISIIWTLSIEDGIYGQPVEVPLYELSENNRLSNIKMFYSLLGVMNDGKALLYIPADNGYLLLFLDTQSRDQKRGNIRFSKEELNFNDFYLSAEGILTAMLVDDFLIKIAWWRTDKFWGDLK
jgi:hypothetical protein